MVAAGFIALAIPVPASSASVPVDDYIVLLRAGVDAPEVAREERRRGNQVEDVFDSRVNGLVAELDPADVKRLRQDPDVAVVERDGVVTTLGSRDSATTLWGLDRIDQRARPGNGRITTSTNGSGVTAYVIDTGIRSDHVQFEGRVAARGYSSILDSRGWEDCQGHGTHVAGTVAGRDYGVAPKADLVSIRVLDCNGRGRTSGVIAGIDWAAADHPAGAPAVANLSLGGGFDSSMNLAIRRLFNDGVSVAVAAGNENTDACKSSPASAPEAITVGSTTSLDARSSFSNFGNCLDLFAPGSNILSAWIRSSTSSAHLSGTSMASPHVAGAAALLLSGQPSLTPTEVADQITSDSTTELVTNAQTGSPNRLLYTGDIVPPDSEPASPSESEPGPEPQPEPEPGPDPEPPADTTPPSAPSLTGPVGPLRSTTATFTFTGEPDGTFQCSLDSASWQACASSLSLSDLAQGGHTFRVRQEDEGGNLSPVSSASWTVDTISPTVSSGKVIRRNGRLFILRLPAVDRGSGLARLQLAGRRDRPRTTTENSKRLSYRASGGRLKVRRSTRPRWYRVSDRAGNWSGWAPIRRPSR